MLYDAEAEKSVVIVFFENEDDYRKGDEILNAMPAGDTPVSAPGDEVRGRRPHDALARAGSAQDQLVRGRDHPAAKACARLRVEEVEAGRVDHSRSGSPGRARWRRRRGR